MGMCSKPPYATRVEKHRNVDIISSQKQMLLPELQVVPLVVELQVPQLVVQEAEELGSNLTISEINLHQNN